MKEKLKLFRESLKLVWTSAPGWALANISLSVVRSFLPLLLVWLLKELIDRNPLQPVTRQAALPEISCCLLCWWQQSGFLDEASSDLAGYVRKKQSLRLESFMYGLLHAKSVRLDLINFERPEYFDCLSRASRKRRGDPITY